MAIVLLCSFKLNAFRFEIRNDYLSLHYGDCSLLSILIPVETVVMVFSFFVSSIKQLCYYHFISLKDSTRKQLFFTLYCFFNENPNSALRTGQLFKRSLKMLKFSECLLNC